MWSDLERPPLRVQALRRALLAPIGPYAALDVVATVPSTNTALAAAAGAGAPDRTVLVAEHQSAGRGRAARSWSAPPRSGLALSVLLRPTEVPPDRWSWLPLLVGVALCRTVSTLGEIPAVLKWPNDLLLGADQRKAAGILAEVIPAGPAVVVGIGLNVSTRGEELPGPPATSLLLEHGVTDRVVLLPAILRSLAGAYAGWRADPGALPAAYRSVSSTFGRTVRLSLPDGTAVEGVADDLDEDGRIVVNGTAYGAGDVVHLRSV